jgi:hypothetical protein
VIAALRRLRRHGHDGDIPDLIEMAWAHAQQGRWDAVERAVHTLQTRHPSAIVALVHDVAGRVLAAWPGFGDRLRILADIGSPDRAESVPAWLVLARGLDDPSIHLEVTRRGHEGQRELAVALLRYATRQEATR